MTSTGVPSARYGISQAGRTLEMTPLFPWRPASLSPTEIFLNWAVLTIILFKMLGSSSFGSRLPSITSILTTYPCFPYGTRSDVSLISLAFSPKIARNNLSSAVSSFSPLGATFPTKMSPPLTSVPTSTNPSLSKFCKTSSRTLGMSRVNSSGPSLVSTKSATNSSIVTEVKTSSLTRRSEMTKPSSYPKPFSEV